MTVQLTSDNSRKQQLLHLLDWLKEIGLVSTYEVEQTMDTPTPVSHRHPSNNGNLSQAAKSALEKVEKLKALAPNWDSYQADPPSPVAIASSQVFIKRADEDGMRVYFVAPGRNGEVLVEFKGPNGKAAEIYFEPQGAAEVLLYDQEECVHEGSLNDNYEKLTHFLNA
ncbi:MAG: hypothetical protein IPN76_21145 [Saprospiraceae bacterium]|nr:hypothetical protein [Saprospiraceae bacterium]